MTTPALRPEGHAGSLFGSVVAVGLVGAWLLLALTLLAVRCDDTCSGDQASWWGYPAQFALAVLGAGAGLVGLGLGFTSRTALARLLLMVGAGAGLVWVFWVFGLGGF